MAVSLRAFISLHPMFTAFAQKGTSPHRTRLSDRRPSFWRAIGTLTSSCSSLVSLARLSVNVSAMRNPIGGFVPRR
jgi:hypothetical protein